MFTKNSDGFDWKVEKAFQKIKNITCRIKVTHGMGMVVYDSENDPVVQQYLFGVLEIKWIGKI